MDRQKIAFPAFSHVYLVFCVALVVFSPFLFAAIDFRKEHVTVAVWGVAAFVSFLMLILLLISNKCVSTDNLSYREGLLYIATYCRTGWVYNTMVIVAPVLIFSFFYAVLFSVVEMVSRKRGYAAMRFHKLIRFAYAHRARQ